MARYDWNFKQYGRAESTNAARTFPTAIRAMVKRKLAESGGNLNSFGVHRNYDQVTASDFDRIKADVLAAGFRFDISAVISVKEAPELLRILLALVVIAGPAIAPTAGGDKTPLRIGVLSDQNGIYSAVTGRGTVEAVHLAVEDADGSVRGRPIEVLQGDDQNKADVSATIARKGWAMRST